jgi:hypothetical protein
MATANVNAPASVRRVKALAVPTSDEAHVGAIPKETIALVGGLVVAVVFWIIGALSWAGAFPYVIRPGTTLGLNSAIDWIVFGQIGRAHV